MKSIVQPVLSIHPPLSAPAFTNYMGLREMAQAFNDIVQHPDCDATYLADFLTTQKMPRLSREVIDVISEQEPRQPDGSTDATWESHINATFKALCGAEDATFAQALEVWMSPGFRAHFRRQCLPSFDELRGPFQKMSLDEQFDVVQAHVRQHGAEAEHYDSSDPSLWAMVHWLRLPTGFTVDDLRFVLARSLRSDSHDKERAVQSTLTMLNVMRRSTQQ
jgi:hypothetical protein